MSDRVLPRSKRRAQPPTGESSLHLLLLVLAISTASAEPSSALANGHIRRFSGGGDRPARLSRRRVAIPGDSRRLVVNPPRMSAPQGGRQRLRMAGRLVLDGQSYGIRYNAEIRRTPDGIPVVDSVRTRISGGDEAGRERALGRLRIDNNNMIAEALLHASGSDVVVVRAGVLGTSGFTPPGDGPIRRHMPVHLRLGAHPEAPIVKIIGNVEIARDGSRARIQLDDPTDVGASQSLRDRAFRGLAQAVAGEHPGMQRVEVANGAAYIPSRNAFEGESRRIVDMSVANERIRNTHRDTTSFGDRTLVVDTIDVTARTQRAQITRRADVHTDVQELRLQHLTEGEVSVDRRTLIAEVAFSGAQGADVPSPLRRQLLGELTREMRTQRMGNDASFVVARDPGDGAMAASMRWQGSVRTFHAHRSQGEDGVTEVRLGGEDHNLSRGLRNSVLLALGHAEYRRTGAERVRLVSGVETRTFNFREGKYETPR